MYTEITREMSDREREELSRRAASTNPPATWYETIKWVALWTTGLILCPILLIAVVGLELHPAIGGIIGGAIFLAAVLCLYAVIILVEHHRNCSRYHRTFITDTLPRIHRAIEDGHVSVRRVTANAVVTIDEYEDEGSGYIYDVGEGRILFLKGQWCYPIDDNMSWPNSAFEMVKTREGDIWIGIFCFGHELPAVRELETTDCTDDIIWADRDDLLAGDLEPFVQSITRISNIASNEARDCDA